MFLCFPCQHLLYPANIRVSHAEAAYQQLCLKRKNTDFLKFTIKNVKLLSVQVKRPVRQMCVKRIMSKITQICGRFP